MKLNLGAGNQILRGAVNHDVRKHRPEIDIVWDLDKLPWPWKDNQFTQIRAIDIFEHLKICLVETLDECWRILRPKGTLILKYPLYTSPTIHEDPTHRWFWGRETLDYFDPETTWGARYSFYTSRHWKILKKELLYPDERSLRATLTPRK